MSDVQIAVIDQQDTQIVLAVPGVQGATGSSIPAGGTADQVLRKNSSTDYDANWTQVTSAMIADGTIVNADINASAAIAGTKISPDFGSQNVTTTGTSTAASFIPTSSTVPTNGVYLPAANSVALSTNGTGRLFVDASGNVGIGSTASSTAARLLDVNGGALQPTFQLRASSATSATTAYTLDTVNSLVSFISSDWPIRYFINGSERLRITSAGLVGVGTSSPDANSQLHIVGSSYQPLYVNTTGVGGGGATFFRSGTQALYVGTAGSSWLSSSSTADGLVRAEANLVLATNGNSRAVTIDTSQQVGIGTSSPFARTEISLTGISSGKTDSANWGANGIIQLNNSDGATTGSEILLLGCQAGGLGQIASGFGFGRSNAGHWGTYLSFYTHSTSTANVDELIERMRVDEQGRLGIGTTGPGQTLSLANAIAPTLGFLRGSTLDMLISSEAAGAAIQTYNNTPIQFSVASGSTGYSERARIDSSGRLLVGTSTARSPLTHTPRIQVEGLGYETSTVSVISNSNDTNGAYSFLGKSRGTSLGSNTIVQSNDEIGGLDFIAADGTQLLRAARITALVDGTPGANDMPGRLVFATTADGASSPTERMRIHNSGTITTQSGLNVGDSSMTSGGTAFILNGAIIGSGAGTNALKWNNGTGVVTYDTSSRLIKNQIVDCPYGIDALKQLQPRKYFRTDDEREEIGFIADEVIQVVPEFVPVGPKSVITRNEADTEEIPLGVNYDRLTAVLTKALQEAVARIEQLEAEMAEVKAQLS